jgi:spore coat polysaccharide biosynthesis predicted glycosyltransferase SpsG
MMPLVECRLEEALFEVCCFGVGSKMFTYYTAEELKEIEQEKERRAKALTVTVYEESSDESADWMELFG